MNLINRNVQIPHWHLTNWYSAYNLTCLSVQNDSLISRVPNCGGCTTKAVQYAHSLKTGKEASVFAAAITMKFTCRHCSATIRSQKLWRTLSVHACVQLCSQLCPMHLFTIASGTA